MDFLQSIIDGVVAADHHGTILAFNPAAERIFGRSAAETIGKDVSVLMPSPYKELHRRFMDQYKKTQKRKLLGLTRELKGVRKDGTVFPLEISLGSYAAQTPGAEGEQFVAIIRDTTARKQREEFNRPLRYKTEFEEISILGYGGFGSVYKCRNRLDDKLYAIKKVHLQSITQDIASSREDAFTSASEGSSKLNANTMRQLKEVKLLASISDHPNIVHYYTSWIEYLPKEKGKELCLICHRFVPLSNYPTHIADCEGFSSSSPDDTPMTSASSNRSSDSLLSPNSELAFERRMQLILDEEKAKVTNEAINMEKAADQINGAHNNDKTNTNQENKPEIPTNGNANREKEGEKPKNAGGRMKKVRISDFEVLKRISGGAFGRVFLVRKKDTQKIYALKVIRKKDAVNKNNLQRVLSERQILHKASDRYVVTLYYSFQSKNNLYFVMEYLPGGDLASLIENAGFLDEGSGRMYISELVLALEHLHKKGIVHRDIKPDNILIDKEGHIKLTDFGLSVDAFQNKDESSSGSSATFSGAGHPFASFHFSGGIPEGKSRYSLVGTPDYLAPEIILQTGHSFAVDWWALGVTLYELLTGTPPFNDKSPNLIFANILGGNVNWPTEPEYALSPNARDLIEKLLNADPKVRLGANGAKEIKRHPFFEGVNWEAMGSTQSPFVPRLDDSRDTGYFLDRVTSEDGDDGSFSLFEDSDYDTEKEEEDAKNNKTEEKENPQGIQLNPSESGTSFSPIRSKRSKKRARKKESQLRTNQLQKQQQQQQNPNEKETHSKEECANNKTKQTTTTSDNTKNKDSKQKAEQNQNLSPRVLDFSFVNEEAILLQRPKSPAAQLVETLKNARSSPASAATLLSYASGENTPTAARNNNNDEKEEKEEPTNEIEQAEQEKVKKNKIDDEEKIRKMDDDSSDAYPIQTKNEDAGFSVDFVDKSSSATDVTSESATNSATDSASNSDVTYSGGSSSDKSFDISLSADHKRDDQTIDRMVVLYIQMELCESATLRDWMENKERTVDPSENLHVFAQIVRGLHHIHKHGILHRDLKPSNIFISENNIVKIGDFGLATKKGIIADDEAQNEIPGKESLQGNIPTNAKLVARTGKQKDTNLTISVGTLLYSAPEQLRDEKNQNYNEKADVFSLGVILAEMYCGPFNTQMERIRSLSNLTQDPPVLPSCIAAHYPEVAELLTAMLSADPNARPSTEDILRHPLVQECLPVCASPSPNRKLTASDRQNSSESPSTGTTPTRTLSSSPLSSSDPTTCAKCANSEEWMKHMTEEMREKDERIATLTSQVATLKKALKKSHKRYNKLKHKQAAQAKQQQQLQQQQQQQQPQQHHHHHQQHHHQRKRKDTTSLPRRPTNPLQLQQQQLKDSARDKEGLAVPTSPRRRGSNNKRKQHKSMELLAPPFQDKV